MSASGYITPEPPLSSAKLIALATTELSLAWAEELDRREGRVMELGPITTPAALEHERLVRKAPADPLTRVQTALGHLRELARRAERGGL